jgi:c(7)-type cytochrome triheme protein
MAQWWQTWKRRNTRRLWSLAVALWATVGALAAGPSLWVPLEKDGLHDPTNPGLSQLQQPAEALSGLPRDSAGNKVRWVQALESGAINPRTNIFPETQVRVLDQDIIISKFGSMPAVKFPHRQHTLWLDCANCHNGLFKDKAGANKFSMVAILNGEQCGVCHGAVAFPLTECNRCHSVPNASLQRNKAAP